MPGLPQVQRVAAYAVIARDGSILLTRLATRITREELWTLPGGGVDHGEDPRDAVVREVFEETGLHAEVGGSARVYSAHLPSTWRDGRRVDVHALRIVYDGWVPRDSPRPCVQEIGGSTIAAAWVPVADILGGKVPVAAVVVDALADHQPHRMQRLAAYALIRRTGTVPGTAGAGEDGPQVLLTRISAKGFHTGAWTLPGGGVGHGEPPSTAVVREVAEECGVDCAVGELLAIHDLHFSGTSPAGRHEDFHGVHLIYAASVPAGEEPRVAEEDGTTDAVAWVSVTDIDHGRIEVLDVVRAALDSVRSRPAGVGSGERSAPGRATR